MKPQSFKALASGNAQGARREGQPDLTRLWILQETGTTSHYGPTHIKGMLNWGWQHGEEPLGSQEIEIGAFEISNPIELTSSVPEKDTEVSKGKFFVWLTGEDNREVAWGYIDVTFTLTGVEAATALAG